MGGRLIGVRLYLINEGDGGLSLGTCKRYIF